MKKWEQYSEDELIKYAVDSTGYKNFGEKIGYVSFSKDKCKKLFLQYPILERILENKGNLIGKKFGKLTVVNFSESYTKSKNNGKKYWECKCDCGNIAYVCTTYLKGGQTKSCGCIQKSIAKSQTFIDLTGQIFGNLTVIKESTSRNGKAYWECKCKCGNIITAQGQLLRNGHKLSCGCLKESQYERRTKEILDEAGYSYIQQYTFEDLIGDTGIQLRFDFAIFKNEKLEYLIELQGQQHYKAVPSWGGEEAFEKRKKYDELKNSYCLKKGLKLITIPYYEEITKEKILL